MQVGVNTIIEKRLLTSTYQPHVKKLTVFSRTPIWFAPGLAGDDFSPECEYRQLPGTEAFADLYGYLDSEEKREKFHTDPITLINHSKVVEKKLNALFKGFYHGSQAQMGMMEFLHQGMVKKFRDPALLEGENNSVHLSCPFND
jgi:hypothetical protein